MTRVQSELWNNTLSFTDSMLRISAIDNLPNNPSREYSSSHSTGKVK